MTLRGSFATVVIPAYNAEWSVRAAIQSALDQTGVDVEVIVVDDGSTDCTADVAESLLRSRHQVIRTPNNGVASARNRGLQIATAPYVAFLDADDLLDADKLACQILHLESHAEAVGNGTLMRYLSQDGRRTRGVSGSLEPFSQQDIEQARLMPFSMSAGLFRRTVALGVGGFDTSLAQCEDLDFVAKMARSGEVCLIPRVLGSYRLHDGSVTAERHDEQRLLTRYVQERAMATAGAALPVGEWLEQQPRSRASARSRSAVALRRAAVLWLNGSPGRAMMYAVAAAVHSPRYSYGRLKGRLGGR